MTKFGIVASVGTATFYTPKSMEKIVETNSLTTSGFNFASTIEEIRGGPGNPLLGQYVHDNSLNLTLEDAQWNMQYLAFQIGSDVHRNAQNDFVRVEKTVASGAISLTGIVPVALVSGADKVIWYRKASSNDWKTIAWTEAVTSIDVDDADGTLYCVEYCVSGINESLTIRSNFIPSIVTAVVIFPIFAGTDGISDRTQVGEIIITIPRFQFDGSMELSLTASGVTTVPISGKALSTKTLTCTNAGGYFGTITEKYYDATWTDGLESFEFDEIGEDPIEIDKPVGSVQYNVADILELGSVDTVYGTYDTGDILSLDMGNLVFSLVTSSAAEGSFVIGDATDETHTNERVLFIDGTKAVATDTATLTVAIAATDSTGKQIVTTDAELEAIVNTIDIKIVAGT